MAAGGGAWAPRNSFKQVSSIESAGITSYGQQGQEAPALGQICQRSVRTLQDQKQQWQLAAGRTLGSGSSDLAQQDFRPSASRPGPPLLRIREKNPGIAYENGSI